MSRLDSFIRRMQAQRDCLNWAAAAVAGVPGPVLELGLGNGRTYDHLRERLPDRRIYVFDRRLASHPLSTPPEADLLLGEIDVTLPRLADEIGPVAALAHSDIGTGEADANATLALVVGPILGRMMAPGGVVVSDQPLDVPGWSLLPDLPGVKPGRYHLYRVG